MYLVLTLCIYEFVQNFSMLSASSNNNRSKKLVGSRSILNFLNGSLQDTQFNACHYSKIFFWMQNVFYSLLNFTRKSLCVT
jgi:hypothetical protein